jgi:hypothetical protein
MANDVHAPAAAAGPADTGEPGLAVTLKGILDDALELMKQQFIMLKAEMKSDFRKVLWGVIPIACGIAPLLLSLVMLCFALVHLIHWAATPAGAPADPASVPLWGCYAIVSGVFLLVGAVLLAFGIHRLKTVNPLPEETAKALEENIKWLMNPNPK